MAAVAIDSSPERGAGSVAAEPALALRCDLCGTQQSSAAAERESVQSNVRRCAHERFTVWRCSGCGSLHSLSPENLERYYELYPIFEQRMNYAMWCAFTTRVRFLKQAGVRPGARVLDYGCAHGLFVEFLRRAGYRASGYDPNVEAYLGTPLPEEGFDAIVSYDVIEHADDPRAFLRRLSHLVTGGGVVVIGTPDASSIELRDPAKYAFELHQPYHVHILSERALRRAAGEAGLDVRRLRHRFCFDTPFPFVNTQFIWRYARACDNTLDATLDIPRLDVLARKPSLLLWALLGYALPHRGSLVMALTKQHSRKRREVRS